MTRVIRKVKYEYGIPIITDFFPNEQVERCGTCVHLVEHILPLPPFDVEHVYTCKYANNLDNLCKEDNLCEEYKQINPFDMEDKE